jgi:hypothetical protein
MFYNELFESVIREAREDSFSQLFEEVLREANNVQGSLYDYADDIINTLNNLGKSHEANQKDIDYSKAIFLVCEVTDLMKKYGITGSEIFITYKKIKEKHYEKGIRGGDLDHVYTSEILKQVCQQLQNPVIISKYITVKTQGKNTVNFYLNLKINGKWLLVGIEIDPNDNYITTIFGSELKDKFGIDKKIKYVQYVDWESNSNTKELIDLVDIDTVNPDVFK